MNKELDIKEFAQRVERVCDFLIDKAGREIGVHAQNDLNVIKKLKEDAADIQFDQVIVGSHTLLGLEAHMRGLKDDPGEKKE